MLSVRELFTEALLLIPEEDGRLTFEQLQNGQRFEARGGVYTFYSEYHEPLYVGISVNLSKRVMEHLGSAKGNIDLVQYIQSDKKGYVSVFYEEDKAFQEVYECYLIAVTSPRYNISKTGRKRI